MKFKRVLLSALFTTSVLASFAQEPEPRDQGAVANEAGKKMEIGYGAKIGICSSSFSQEQFKVGSQIGGMIGGFVNYKVMDMLTIQLEAMYMQQGGKEYSIESGDNPYIFYETSISRITLHNIEIPLLVRVTPPGIGSIFGVKWHALAGPALGINMAATTHTTSEVFFTSGNTGVFKERALLSPNNYETLQWGAYIGVGIETELKSFLLTVDARYRQGVNTINNNYDIKQLLNGFGDGTSNTVALTVGLGF